MLVTVTVAGGLWWHAARNPAEIYNRYGRYVPAEWSRIIRSDDNMLAIEARLGHPTVDESVKGVKKWILPYPWGEKRLELIYADSQHAPDIIIYRVRLVDGHDLCSEIVKEGTALTTQHSGCVRLIMP